MKQYYLNFNGSNICIYESGHGEIPIVLLHGAGLDSAMLSWKEVMQHIPSKYTVYAIDLLGHGNSDRLDNISGNSFYTIHNECLEHIINQLNITNFILSGISMGGAIAIGYTLTNPTKVKALIPVNSWGLLSKMPYHPLYYWYVNTSMTSKSFQYYAKYKWLIKASISYSLIGDKRKVSEELIDNIHQMCLNSDVGKSMKDYQRSSITKNKNIPDFTEQISSLTLPILFINGEKDALVKVKDISKISNAVSNSSLHIMKDCKHWAPKERPEEYVEAVESFISKL